MQSWAMAQITDAFPPAQSLSALDDLQRVEPFFARETSLLFGMKTTPEAFDDPASLIERARAGLLAWFEHFGKTGDDAEQARLYSAVRTFAPDLAEPDSVKRQHEAAEVSARARQAVLADRPRPMRVITTVAPALARALAQVRGPRSDEFFELHGKQLAAACKLGRFAVSLDHFEWLQAANEALDPAWDELTEASFDAPFFPFAGADGDYLGVLVVAGSNDAAPVVVYSHEEGYRAVAANLAEWNALCDQLAAGTKPRRGSRPPRVSVQRTAYDDAFDAARKALAALPR